MLPFPDSDFILIPEPASLDSSPTMSSFANIPELAPSIKGSDPDISSSVDLATCISDPVLSVISTPESIEIANCYPYVNEQTVTDLHVVSEPRSQTAESKLFVIQVILYGPGAMTSCFQANIDDGAMVNVINLKTFKKAIKHLRKFTHLTHILHMADASEVKSQGLWTGTFQWSKVKIRTSFEVINSKEDWSMLIGKSLLEQLGAMHDYTTDTIIIPNTPKPIIIHNILNTPAAPIPKSSPHHIPVLVPNSLKQHIQYENPTYIIVTIPADSVPTHNLDLKQKTSTNEHFVFPVSQQLPQQDLDKYTTMLAVTGAYIVLVNKQPQVSMVTNTREPSPCSPILLTATESCKNHEATSVWPISDDTEDQNLGEIPKFPDTPTTPSIYTRQTDPFNLTQVMEILKQIKIGKDLMPEQKIQVCDLCVSS